MKLSKGNSISFAILYQLVEMFKDFALKSGIRGFTYAETSNTLTKLMWYGIICVCTGMTIYDVHGTVKYFMSFPTTTKVSLINNRSISLGSPTFCVAFANPLSNLNGYQNATKEQIYELLESVKHYYINESLSLASAEDVEAELFQTALSLIVAIVTSITRAEHYISNETDMLRWGYVRYVEQNDSVLTIIEGSNQMEFAYEWLAENNISARTAAMVSAQLLCQQFKFLMTDYSRVKENCEIVKPTWLGMQVGSIRIYEEVLCLQLPAEWFTFDSNMQVTSVKVTRSKMYKHYTSSAATSHFATMDFSQDPLPLIKGINVAYQLLETSGTLKVTILAQYKQLDRQQFPCSDSQYSSLCQFQYRKQMIKDECKCDPLDLLIDSFSDSEGCSMKTFSVANVNCSKRTTEFIPTGVADKCHPKCEGPTLSFNSEPRNKDNNETSITHFVDTFNYPVFEPCWSRNKS